MIRKMLVTGALVVLGLSMVAPARAADLVYATGPASNFVNYTIPYSAIRSGDTLTFANIDIQQHDFVSGDHSTALIGPDRPWCADAGFRLGHCPLLWTPLLGLGGKAMVLGLESLHPGDQIPFTCSIHSNMNGTLIVSPE